LALRYVDNYGKVTGKYPYNPNGSPNGIAGMTTTDGRVTIMMPHPERVVRCAWPGLAWPAVGLMLATTCTATLVGHGASRAVSNSHAAPRLASQELYQLVAAGGMGRVGTVDRDVCPRQVMGRCPV
jgi:hypothetical protein